MAPEILNHNKKKSKKEYKEYNGKEIDIFAVGVLLFGLVSGEFPFEESL